MVDCYGIHPTNLGIAGTVLMGMGAGLLPSSYETTNLFQTNSRF